MATYTPNFNLYKPDASDDFADFRAEHNNNMDIIDQNLGGGGGGHTIYDENGSAMTQRAGLEFTGSVSVSDDSVNDKTIIDILGGNVYGAFIDTDRVIKATTTISGETTVTYTATEDCVVTFTGVSDYEKACEVKIDSIRVWRNYNATNSGGIEANSTNVFLRKGQVISVSNGSSQYNGNYTVYGIKQGTNGIFAPVIYSDNERCIGVWRDNKPLYQKTVHITALPSAVGTPTSYVHNIADIDLICDYEGTIHFADGNASKFDRLAMVTNGTANIDAISSMVVYVSKTSINITVGANRSTASADFTIRYTKTTDTAGSGDWTTDGTPTVHYSTNERVIGTYIDGKPLYEKTFVQTLNNIASGTETNMADVTGLSIDEIANITGRVNYYNGANWFNVNLGTYFGAYVHTDGYLTFIQTMTGQTTNRSYKVLVTLQYTKTTD